MVLPRLVLLRSFLSGSVLLRRLGVLVATLALASTLTAGPASAVPVVTVAGGAVSGFSRDGIDQYFGVPMAVADRYASPRPAPGWTGVREAVRHDDQCPQAVPLPIDLPPIPALPANSEDCLGIDLYVPPNAAGRSLPVMVYLYGGAFVVGNTTQYDSPSQLVRDGDVIVAIPNYRVGSFGFLALPELAAESGGATGNQGIEDQQFALRWVRDNIAAFGGDPSNVTIFGESAGGMSVCTHLASPRSAGLFHKAIVQSGPCSRSPLVPPSREVAFARGAAFAEEMGCGDGPGRLACLRSLPVDRLLGSATHSFTSPNATWTPVVDGVVLTDTPEGALRAGASADVPILLGSNSEEGGTFVVLFDYAAGRVPTAESVAASVREVYPEDADAILATYPVAAYPTPADALSAVWTDSLFACPTVVTADAARAGGARVWQYRFTDAPLAPSGPLLPGAFHAADVPYLFSRLGGIPVPWTGSAAALADRMKRTWATFAHTGDPNGPGLPAWPDSGASGHPVLQIDRDRAEPVTDVADVHRCGFWAGVSPADRVQ